MKNKLLVELLFILEGRPDYVAKQLGQKLVDAAKDDSSYKGEPTPEAVVSELAKADVSPKNENIMFITKMYVAKQFKMEDIGKIKDELTSFFLHRKKIENKDLNSYKSLDQLYDVLEKFKEETPDVSNKELARQIKSDSKKIMDTPHFKVIQPMTEKAACFYGSGTKWCTATENNNAFNNYSDDLMIIIVELEGKQRKFQLHVRSEQFMNERDQTVSAADIKALSALDEWKQFLDMMINKHYSAFVEQK